MAQRDPRSPSTVRHMGISPRFPGLPFASASAAKVNAFFSTILVPGTAASNTGFCAFRERKEKKKKIILQKIIHLLF